MKYLIISVFGLFLSGCFLSAEYDPYVIISNHLPEDCVPLSEPIKTTNDEYGRAKLYRKMKKLGGDRIHILYPNLPGYSYDKTTGIEEIGIADYVNNDLIGYPARCEPDNS